ncbi:TGF-beta-activated kinase 1 and MAP3K7-binding protein 1-like [Octopus vulgaris]|uniref:TGF-beta-activated kinase 1 and MAP3K7-binding protein 1-like n=1 Tax=Octopus vulgaris TaxID=6645 RepID=A0AA36AQ24_OCTVU|nr:TGF-beta-activated kinase 1 and MAP3K7-binding protein 1-like [Octopus vulgaris]
MEGKVDEAMRQQSDEVSINNKEKEDDFFSDVTHPKESSKSHRSLKDKAQHLVKTRSETNFKDLLTDAAFLGEMSSGIISNGTTYDMNPWLGMQGNRWTDDLVKCEQTSLGTATNAFYPGDRHPIEQHEFEDRSFYFCSDDGCSLYGVFDGHDGSKLSNFVAQRIPADLLLGQLSGPKTDEEIKSILQQAFVAVERGYFETVNDPLSEKAALQLQIRENMHYKPSQDIQKKLQEVEAKISGGTTATVALIHHNKLFVINVDLQHLNL